MNYRVLEAHVRRIVHPWSEDVKFPSSSTDHGLTESQNGKDWKGPLWIICSNPSAKTGPSRAVRNLSRQVLNISGEGESTTSLSSLLQCSVILIVKKFFLILRWNFIYFSLCPLPLVLSLGTTEKSLAPSS